MTASAEKLRTELTKLSDAERGELAHYLIQSLDQESDDGADKAWDDELDRRGNEIRNHEANGKTAEEVFSELREKHS